MPSIKLSKRAWEDLIRLRSFIAKKNPKAAQRAADKIISSIDQLITFPLLGRPCPPDSMPVGFRELVVDFGSDGYIVLYRVESDEITIVAMRHQRESGFDLPQGVDHG